MYMGNFKSNVSCFNYLHRLKGENSGALDMEWIKVKIITTCISMLLTAKWQCLMLICFDTESSHCLYRLCELGIKTGPNYSENHKLNQSLNVYVRLYKLEENLGIVGINHVLVNRCVVWQPVVRHVSAEFSTNSPTGSCCYWSALSKSVWPKWKPQLSWLNSVTTTKLLYRLHAYIIISRHEVS